MTETTKLSAHFFSSKVIRHLKFIKSIFLVAVFFLGCEKGAEPEEEGERINVTAPFVGITMVSKVTDRGAEFNSEVLSDGGAPILENGFCWSLNANPTTLDSCIKQVSGKGKYTGALTTLRPNKTYHVRAYAVNKVGTTYGEQASFTTSSGVHEIVFKQITAITLTTAIGEVEIKADGPSPIIDRGICWSTAPEPTIGNFKVATGTGGGIFTAQLSPLIAGTKYYARVYAINSQNTPMYSANTISFTTLQALPELTTLPVSPILSFTAECGGKISLANGPIKQKGICWSLTSVPTIDDDKVTFGPGETEFKGRMPGLSAKHTYYVRAFATNEAGTGYGPEVKFSTTPTVADAEGNIYQTVNIGSQTWMVESLRTRKFNNGDAIQTTSNPSQDLSSTIFPLYQWAYAGDEKYAVTFGRLYTYNVVKDARQISPVGWRIPSDDDWSQLTSYVGANEPGGALKEASTALWFPANIGFNNGKESTNSSGFSARPGGLRNEKQFVDINASGVWWSSTGPAGMPHFWMFGSSTPVVKQFVVNTNVGMSVRCIKN
ncbi:MAG TPA: FISUMP domain-containing protein [Pedobacter sp.]|nr:FISUMP domain-containing protein [Pedobacter sp.]